MTEQQIINFANANLPYVKARRAGDFVFTAGLMELAPPDFMPPHSSPMKAQTRGVYDDLQSILGEFGAALDDVLGFVQYFATRHNVNDYLEQRRAYYEIQPTSTGVISTAFPSPAALLQMEAIAGIPKNDIRVESAVDTSDPDYAHLTAFGFSHALAYGDWIFCAGVMAMDGTTSAPYEGGIGTGIAHDVRWDPNVWDGKQVKLELNYIFEHSLEPLLNRSGSSVENIVYADVHLVSPEDDYAAFLEEWKAIFGGNIPLTVVTSASDLGAVGGRIEVTPIALKTDSTLEIRDIDIPDITSPFGEGPVARQVGDLLFISTQVAANSDGPVQPAPGERALAFFDQTEFEMQVILDRLELICQAAGASLADVVKARLSLMNMTTLPSAMRPWVHRLGRNVAASFVEHSGAPLVHGTNLAISAIASMGENE